MKRSLLLGALLMGLVGCGGGGDSGTDAERDVRDYVDRLESAYQYGLDRSSTSRFGDLLSVNYCQDGRDKYDEVAQFQRDVQDAQDDGADEVRIRNISIDNSRYSEGTRYIRTYLRYRVEFYDNGTFIGDIPTFEDDRFEFQYEGGQYRALGSDAGCFLVAREEKKPASRYQSHRAAK